MTTNLQRNRLPDNYMFDSREGRQVPGGALPPIGKRRSEQMYFLEGVHWLMEHLVGFRANIAVEEQAVKEAEKRYPTFRPETNFVKRKNYASE